jgi:hypothetical protein
MVLVTSTAFPNSRIYGLCGGIDLIVPSVDDRVAVEIMDELHDALFQLVFRADADVTKHGAGGFGEEPLDEIEPRAVLGGEHELKAPFRSRRQPSLGLLRDVRGVIVEDDLDPGHRGVGSIQHTEEFDEFATAMAVLDEGVHLSSQQVDAGYQGDRSLSCLKSL